MIRALYTAASGMNAQQLNIDNVAHNLANVNTIGFKKSRVEFEDLVYQQIKAPGTASSATGEAPIGLETGIGTRPVATARDFASRQPQVDQQPARPRHRRPGLPPGHHAGGRHRVHAIRLAAPERRGAAGHRGRLSARAGHLDPPERDVGQRLARRHRVGVHSRPGGSPADRHDRAGVVPESCRACWPRAAISSGVTTASGEPQTALPGTDGLGTIAQGFLEESNVSVVEEMVNMILGQRAYEANSRVVKVADEMLRRSTTCRVSVWLLAARRCSRRKGDRHGRGGRRGSPAPSRLPCRRVSERPYVSTVMQRHVSRWLARSR